ncbi:Acetyltransferase [marine gamma proteobacterium HTCC2143]|jgi:ribosomal protein S18 acetylase RimI-like enzyme|uniref:Acetyltransferase n=1 Tax=marine gamma proteobacterium HTCC2143 TaxID=247633 RepID=A0YH97_9GAMM|nr:Acetyltransferase [marine gamma proteobacterium HTCC2143]
MAIEVSNLSVSDREEWEGLYRGYADFYQVPMTKKILDQVWSWIFDSEQPFYALIAKDANGVALGIMHYRQMASPLRGAMVGFLDDLYVLPGCRGTGIVDALFDALKVSAKQHGWPFVRWITADNNYRGRGVYDKLAERTPWITYQMPTDNQLLT